MAKFEKIVFAGHSAAFIHAADRVIGIDPWLEGNPSCPSNLKQPERLDLMILTHGHSDHAADAVQLARKHECTVAATFELAGILAREGVPQEQLVFMNKGGTVTIKGIDVTLTNAFHSSSYDTENGPVYAGEPCGAIVNDGSHRIFHAGDTCLFSDLKLIGEFYQPEVALIPIGDRFTMGPVEAARAAKWVGCRTAIPIHYKTFPLLTGIAEDFQKACKQEGIEVAVLDPGQEYALS